MNGPAPYPTPVAPSPQVGAERLDSSTDDEDTAARAIAREVLRQSLADKWPNAACVVDATGSESAPGCFGIPPALETLSGRCGE